MVGGKLTIKRTPSVEKSPEGEHEGTNIIRLNYRRSTVYRERIQRQMA